MLVCWLSVLVCGGWIELWVLGRGRGERGRGDGLRGESF